MVLSRLVAGSAQNASFRGDEGSSWVCALLGVYPGNKSLGATGSLSHAWLRAVWARRCHGYAELASATLRAETPRMTGERSVDVAAASGTLHVALLGGFSVRVGSRAVPGSWRLRKSKTLVKLLALADGHRAHRDVLAGVLWPGLDPAAAANNLHQAAACGAAGAGIGSFAFG